MSKKSLVNSRKHPFWACQHLAIPLLALGLVPGVLAQPSSITFNDTISFAGTGTLLVSQSTFALPGVPDPVLSVALSGTGIDTDTEVLPGVYNVNSSFHATANISIPNSVAPGVSPFSVTAPRVGADPGLSLTTPVYSAPSSPASPPFYGLFPPPAGQDYSDTIASRLAHNFQYAPDSILYVKFNGEADLIFGDTPVLTSVTPDPSITGDDFYSYSYANSDLRLSAGIGVTDPAIDFKGTVVITTTAAAPAPDSSPGLAGVFALLAVCAGGAWQKARAA